MYKKSIAVIILMVFWLFSFFDTQALQRIGESEIKDGAYEIFEAAKLDSPKISSPAAVAIDTVNGRILYNKNAFSKRQMASTTKMMTAILAIEKGNLEDIVTVSRRAASVGGSQANLKTGEKIRLKDLLYALMLPSGNDAAIAIAEHIAGSVEGFLEMMNRKAVEIGAKNTKFGSPHGLDRNNYSTAYDLAVIARYCMRNPIFAEVVRTKSINIPREGMERGSEYHNTNEILGSYEGANGIKTGYTGPAGRCLVASATRDDWQVISVVLGASSVANRSADTRKILDYVFENFPLITVLPDGQNMASIPVIKGKRERVRVFNKGEVRMHLNDAELAGIKREYILPDQLHAPVQMGQKVGEVIIKLGDSTIGKCELLAGEDVPFWTVDMNLKKFFNQWINIKELFQQRGNI